MLWNDTRLLSSWRISATRRTTRRTTSPLQCRQQHNVKQEAVQRLQQETEEQTAEEQLDGASLGQQIQHRFVQTLREDHEGTAIPEEMPHDVFRLLDQYSRALIMVGIRLFHDIVLYPVLIRRGYLYRKRTISATTVPLHSQTVNSPARDPRRTCQINTKIEAKSRTKWVHST